MKRDYSEHIGEQNVNKNGTTMTIIEFKNTEHIKIQFEDEHKYTKDTTYSNFNRGVIKNPYDKTICGVACTGDGRWKISENNKLFKEYKTWHNMIGRCYTPKWNARQNSYKGCTVCEEWHNYQTFRDWWEDNYYDIGTERMDLDKDILHKGNKEYSPSNCIFVPHRINLLLINRKLNRGDFPLGVHENKKGSNTYTVSTNNKNGKPVKLGKVFYDENEAFEVYKTYREKVIKEVADDYKDRIPIELYNALYTYEIDIND
ncbi:AP2 domain-containing protein [Clostridium beijerinckii]|uniref:AP2 domain-containing protein n=1 Tax=Clostridium beijerinckii TaxID=1520 RepID=UPI00156FEFCC|nr:AP2 domain-containing protein [Clostridium beijerinckii]NRU52652.1 hypothetical protein [Clostridium beijerinckii]NYC68695.1 hypothetical protein [Clostridium beijerinckii]NYC91844.1 hypothetical protein [Clostridium beijerinckii]